MCVVYDPFPPDYVFVKELDCVKMTLRHEILRAAAQAWVLHYGIKITFHPFHSSQPPKKRQLFNKERLEKSLISEEEIFSTRFQIPSVTSSENCLLHFYNIETFRSFEENFVCRCSCF